MFAKLALLSCLALCAAVAPPTISLDLSAATTAAKLSKPIYRTNDLRPEAKSRQDWTEKCPAGVSTSTATCPFPVAKAYDHQDKEVQVNTRVYLVDLEGKTVNRKVAKVDFSKRSTYLFKYDASDKAGNHAEQVVFALILDDTTTPVSCLLPALPDLEGRRFLAPELDAPQGAVCERRRGGPAVHTPRLRVSKIRS